MTAVIVAMNLWLLATTMQAPVDSGPVECTFANPRYVGTCVEKVTPEKDQTPFQACRTILACLNDTRCIKTYCQATTIRSGWSLVSPKPDKEER